MCLLFKSRFFVFSRLFNVFGDVGEAALAGDLITSKSFQGGCTRSQLDHGLFPFEGSSSPCGPRMAAVTYYHPTMTSWCLPQFDDFGAAVLKSAARACSPEGLKA